MHFTTTVMLNYTYQSNRVCSKWVTAVEGRYMKQDCLKIFDVHNQINKWIHLLEVNMKRRSTLPLSGRQANHQIYRKDGKNKIFMLLSSKV